MFLEGELLKLLPLMVIVVPTTPLLGIKDEIVGRCAVDSVLNKIEQRTIQM
jgi:hypothetical protein